MNYLAHLYLSGESEKVIVGNFIGDYVKGKSFTNYPKQIACGIKLHRAIDSFTDQHNKFGEARMLFRDDFRLYSGIVVDFFYDHFLAKNWEKYSAITLQKYAKKIHTILISNFGYLPPNVKRFLPFLIKNKRLESYSSIDGITRSLQIMSKYTSLPPNSDLAKEILIKNYEFLEKNFEVFFTDLVYFVEKEHGIKIKKTETISSPHVLR
jgi:acyl carrier protein phosphodiesterase